MIDPRAVWVSTSLETRGGVSSFVRVIQQTPLWETWRIAHIATHRDGSALAKLGAFLHGGGSVVWLLATHRPAVLHLHMASYGSFARKSVLAWAGRLRRVPVVVHVHGAEFDVFFERSPRLVKSYISATLKHSSAIVALGETWAERLARMAPDARITVIPNAVGPQQAVPQPRGQEPVRVLFLGKIGERKGAFTLIEAWSTIVDSLRNDSSAELVLAGDGEVERARELISERGLEGRTRVLGWTAPADVQGLLRESHVLVLPSRSEGQPMAVLEAMAHGLCVVVTNVGGLADLVDAECGVLVPVDDEQALAAALTSVITDHEQRARLGAAALSRVRQRFDAEVTWRAIDALYREVTS